MIAGMLYSQANGSSQVAEGRLRAFVVRVEEKANLWKIHYQLEGTPPGGPTANWVVYKATDEADALEQGKQSMQRWGVELVDERA